MQNQSQFRGALAGGSRGADARRKKAAGTAPEPETPAEKPAGPFVSGFVSILGRPNVGKSTLMNALIGTKIAIVSDKPQTTRTGIQGVLTAPGGQIVFVDTPGIHKAHSGLNKRMMASVREALDQRDLLLYVADATAPFTTSDREALDLVKKSRTPAFLVLNKIDLLRDKPALLPLIERYRDAREFAEYFPVTAPRRERLR